MKRLPLNLRESDSLAGKLIKATLGSAGVRIVGMALTFLVGVQLARYLGPAGYGIYGTVMAVVSILLVPAQLGLPQLIARDIPAAIVERDFAKVKGTLICFTVAVLIASIAMVMVGIAVSFLKISNSFGGAYYWGLAAVPLIALSNLGAGALRGFHHVVGAQYYEALVRPATLTCLLFLVSSYSGGLSTAAALALQALATLVALAMCIWHVLKICMNCGVSNGAAAMQPSGWIKNAVPMAGTEMIRALEGQYPVLLIGLLASIVDVGHFRVALSAAGFFGLPASLINVVVMSYVATMHAQGDRARLQLLATGSAVVMLASTLVLTVVIYLFGAELIVLFFGDAFRSSWPVLVCLAIAYSINAFFGLAATILNMTGQERVVVIAYVSGLVVGIALTLALLNPLGIMGAGVAAIASELVKGTVMWFAAVRRLDIDPAATSIIRHWTDWRQFSLIKPHQKGGQ